MTTTGWVTAGILAVNLLLLALLVARRDLAGDRYSRLLLLFGALLLPALGVLATSSDTLERSKDVSFCMSCHEMGRHGNSLESDDEEVLPAVHWQNNYVPRKQACYHCHTDYTMYGTVQAKLGGLKHVWVHYLGEPPEKLKLYAPFNPRTCLRCHAESRKFLKRKQHREGAGSLPKILTGEQSCTEKGCHSVGHAAYDEEE